MDRVFSLGPSRVIGIRDDLVKGKIMFKSMELSNQLTFLLSLAEAVTFKPKQALKKTRRLFQGLDLGISGYWQYLVQLFGSGRSPIQL